MLLLPKSALGALFLAAASSALAQTGSAVYDVTFDSTWSSSTHPGAFPGGAHYSPLIGAVHGAGVSFWEPGGIASPGIEQMAETGGTSSLRSEIDAAIAGGTAMTRLQGPGLGAAGNHTMMITATPEHSEVTLVTMIAPSPDWFVGIDGQSLLENGLWVDQITVPLVAWDAGTDSGTNFTSSNQNTNPQDPIALVTGVPAFVSTPLGTLTLTRRHGTIVYGNGLNPAGTIRVDGSATLGSTVTVTIADPNGVMPTPAQTFLAVSAFLPTTFPSGRILPGFGMQSATSNGELLIGAPLRRVPGDPFTGSPVAHDVVIPNVPALVGMSLYAQGVFFAPGKIGVTDAVQIAIGMP